MSSIWMVVIKYQSNLTLYHNSLSWLQYTELKTRRTLRLLYNYQASMVYSTLSLLIALRK